MAVVTQLLVALDDAVPQAVHRRRRIVHVDENAVRRQILEQVGGSIEEQGQEIFDSAGCDSRTDVAINRLFREIAGESQPVAAAELAHRFGIQRRLARGEQLDAIQLVQGALRVRIEAADAVDVAIQHVDSIGGLGSHGEDVDQRAADGEFTVCDDLGDGGISGQGQLRTQRSQVQALADVNLEGVGLDVAARGQSLQQGVDRDQPDAAAGARQLCQGCEPRRGDIRVRREAVVGQGLQIGKHPDVETGPGKESNFVPQGLCIARILRNDDEGSGANAPPPPQWPVPERRRRVFPI